MIKSYISNQLLYPDTAIVEAIQYQDNEDMVEIINWAIGRITYDREIDKYFITVESNEYMLDKGVYVVKCINNKTNRNFELFDELSFKKKFIPIDFPKLDHPELRYRKVGLYKNNIPLSNGKQTLVEAIKYRQDGYKTNLDLIIKWLYENKCRPIEIIRQLIPNCYILRYVGDNTFNVYDCTTFESRFIPNNGRKSMNSVKMNNCGKRKDIMVDIETLGNRINSTIFQIAAISFDLVTGEHYSTFNQIADIGKSNILDATGSTIKWWLNTDKELLTKLLHEGTVSSKELLTNFYNWLNSEQDGENNIYLWGNGILFDNKMIQYQMESIDLKYPIFFKNDRDVRTIMELACDKLGITKDELQSKFMLEDIEKHNAVDDVKQQIHIVSQCYNLLIN